MTKKGGRQAARSGGATGGRSTGSGEGPAGFFPSFLGGGGGGDGGAESASGLAAGDGADPMGFSLGGGSGAAPSPALLAQMFGQGVGDAAFGPTAATAAAPDDGVDKSRWHIIYPAYLDKKKTVAGGRRVSLSIAVQEPRVEEMKKICDHLRVPAAIEYWKRYPRDWLFYRGRLRVQFKDSSNNSLYNPEIPNKKALMRRMCELIPQLKSRSTGAGAPGGGAAPVSSSGKKKRR